MVEISPDVAEAITASAPVKPKKKMSIWTKVFAIVVIVSMTGWVFAAYLQGNDNTTDNTNKDANLFEISGYSFYALQDKTFGTVIKGNGANIPIVFRLDPRNASNISIDNTSATQILTSEKVYVVVNPNQTDLAKIAVAAAEISRIPPLYNISVIGAYTQDSNPPNPDVPIRTCDDASSTTSVIYLGIGNETKIENIDGCVNVIGKNADELILAADKLGMNLVGIRL
jgi:hypothetical protein